MVDIDIQHLRYDQKEVGKTFSSSKILYTWKNSNIEDDALQ